MKEQLARISIRQVGLYVVLVAVGGAGSLLAAKARAAIPDENVLTYTGFLEKPDGTPLTDNVNVRVSLWDAADDGEGMKLCEASGMEITPVSGRFQLPLPPACTGKVQANGNVWIETEIDGASLGRTPIGAVPYAINAATADAAGGALAQQVVPAGAVMPFDLAACPPGWTALEAAAGRAIVGVSDGLKLGDQVGNDSVTLTESQMPAHTHGINDPEHAHPAPGASYLGGGAGTDANIMQGGKSFGTNPTTGRAKTGITVNAAGGGKPFDNRQASLALLYCKKN